MGSIADNIAEIRNNIALAKVKSPNSEQDITLVAVTKMHGVEEIKEVLACGQTLLGENRVQELLDKYDAVGDGATWHIIGHLQSNKVKYITDKVAMIHSLESESLAKELSSRMQALGKTMDCLVQVNITDEESKFGLEKTAVVPFLQQVSQMPVMLLRHRPTTTFPVRYRYRIFPIFRTVKLNLKSAIPIWYWLILTK